MSRGFFVNTGNDGAFSLSELRDAFFCPQQAAPHCRGSSRSKAALRNAAERVRSAAVARLPEPVRARARLARLMFVFARDAVRELRGRP